MFVASCSAGCESWRELSILLMNILISIKCTQRHSILPSRYSLDLCLSGEQVVDKFIDRPEEQIDARILMIHYSIINMLCSVDINIKSDYSLSYMLKHACNIALMVVSQASQTIIAYFYKLQSFTLVHLNWLTYYQIMKQGRSNIFQKFLTKKLKNNEERPTTPLKSQDVENKYKGQNQSHKKESHITPSKMAPLASMPSNNPPSILRYPIAKTQLLDNIERQDTRQQISQQKYQVGSQLILIGPFDLVNSQQQQFKLQQLLTHCDKKSIIQWIKLQHERRNPVKELANLQKINDQVFWVQDMQKVITMLLRQQKEYNGCIQMLPQFNITQQIQLTRRQIFLLISSMFLSIIPRQVNNDLVSFIELMVVRPADEKVKHKPPVRLQKLKCVINYLKYMLNNEQNHHEKITIQRVYSSQPFACKENIPLFPVSIDSGKIQSGYGKGIIIDFANLNVGGGFLTNGSAQQEILFSIFPEMIVTKLLCQSLRHNEAIIVHGARRVNGYEGYSHNFKFLGTYYDDQLPQESCIVAVDAIDYTHGMMKKYMQYGQKLIKRELHKIFLGIEAARFLVKERQVYTGRWGCGVFGADQYLKFCIQWIACSEAGLSMRFFTDQDAKVKQLTLLVENAKHLTTSELLFVLEEYGRNNPCSQKGCNEKGFLQYLKYTI